MNHYPTYRSPIRLLKELGLDASKINAEALKLERKRLLLEVQISPDQTVQVGTKTCSKNDIITLFDEVSSITNIDYHLRIFNETVLLDFLENFVISDSLQKIQLPSISFESETDRQQFKYFISPYLANSIDKSLSKIIRNSSYDQLEKLILFFSFLNSDDALFAFRKFNSLCETLKPRLVNAAVVNSVFPFSDFLFLRDPAFYAIANEANKHYLELANLLAHTLINFTVDIKDSPGRANHLYKIYKRLYFLNCSSELKSLIFQNKSGFRRDTLMRINDTFGIGWRYIIIGSIVSIFLILSFTFGDVDFEKAYNRRNQEPEKPTLNEFDKLELRRVALEQQYQFNKISPIKVAKFDTTAFRIFRDSTYSRVVQKRFSKNELFWDSLPSLLSPLRISDSLDLLPFGKKVNLWNETESEMLMVIRDRNVISTFYVPSNSVISVAVDPRSSVFFYSGKNWNLHQTIVYEHPYKHLMSDGILLRFSGSFSETSEIDHRFMKNIYLLRNGTIGDLFIEEIDGDYKMRSTNLVGANPLNQNSIYY